MNEVINIVVMGKPEPRGSKKPMPIYEKIKDANGDPIIHPKTGKPRRRVKMDDRDRALINTIDDNKASEGWMKKVQRAAAIAMGGRLPTKAPVKLTLDFYLERPLYHFGTGKNAGILKSQFVNAKHVVRPDRLKLSRAIEDALAGKEMGRVFENDAQTIDGPVRKHYCAPGDMPRVEIQIEIAAVVATVQRSLIT